MAPVYEIGRLPGNVLYSTMKRIEGHTQERMLHQRNGMRDRLDCFIRVFGQVSQPLACAHSKGLLHRDLKPHNVMAGEFWEVQVIDWGLAKVLSPALRVKSPCGLPLPFSSLCVDHGSKDTGSPPQTRAAAVMGTPAHISPEQARDDESFMSTPSALFGLGAI